MEEHRRRRVYLNTNRDTRAENVFLYVFVSQHQFFYFRFCVHSFKDIVFFFGATAQIWTLAYLHETLRFTSVF
jgi:hypothetical protein